MIFEQNKFPEKVGKTIGFVFSYFLFTTILFFLLKFLNKIPLFWSYLHVMNLTLMIVLAGIFLQKVLK